MNKSTPMNKVTSRHCYAVVYVLSCAVSTKFWSTPHGLKLVFLSSVIMLVFPTISRQIDGYSFAFRGWHNAPAKGRGGLCHSVGVFCFGNKEKLIWRLFSFVKKMNSSSAKSVKACYSHTFAQSDL